jgi:hypothetical protein
MQAPAFILELNSRVWLRTLGGEKPLKLDQVPDSLLDQWQELGIDAVWLMGIWHASELGQRIARNHEGLKRDYAAALPDMTDSDIGGSPYAVANYTILPELGTRLALLQFRQRLRDRGIRLILDFVPNHTALDHPWVLNHPEWYRQGTAEDLERDPDSFYRAVTVDGEKIIAHGRDPYFPAWTDTAQLDYCNPGLREELDSLLAHLASLCDGVRCDMAMLVLSDVYEKTWGQRPDAEFWPMAIQEARMINPEFVFLAEVYWEKDESLLEMGFDLTYDKLPLDRAVDGPPWTRELFELPEAEHRKRVRFLENHDEPRIASRLEHGPHFAAAAWLFSLPGTRLLYEGQFEGSKVRLPVQLLRAPQEETDTRIQEFYSSLLATLRNKAVREGQWLLLEPRSSWHGNESFLQILGQGYDLKQEHIRIFVNLSAERAQCWVDLRLNELKGKEVILQDQLSPISYVRDGVELMMRGLYLDVAPFHVHIFSCEIREQSAQNQSPDDTALPDAEVFSKRFE